MKYYAVTNDPAELMHYGVKGMKWGVIRTDAQLGHPRKPRSAAYKKASSKLSKMMKSGIKKAEAHWQEYNSPASRKERAKKREAKQMDKYIQQARQGRLKYGKLTDAQVKRVTDRLYLERQARQLGNTEQDSFGRRLRTAVSAGVISGVGQGVSTIVGEQIGRKSRLKTQRLMSEQQERFDKRRERRQIRNELDKKAAQDRYEAKSSTQRRRAKQKVREQNYETLYEEGRYGTARTRSQAERAKRLREQNKEVERQERLTEKAHDTYVINLAKAAANSEASKLYPGASTKSEKKQKNKSENKPKKEQNPVSVNVYYERSPRKRNARKTHSQSDWEKRKRYRGI